MSHQGHITSLERTYEAFRGDHVDLQARYRELLSGLEMGRFLRH